jgi:autophagy-related protein 13
VSLGAEERANLSLGALHRQQEYESSGTTTHRAQRETRPLSSNEDTAVPPGSITREQGSHKGALTSGPTAASSSSSHHHVYQPRFNHSRGRGSSGGHHSLSSGSSSLARGAVIPPSLAERESERDGNGSGSNSATSAMEDRRGVGRRPSAGRGGPPQSAQLEEDEPLLFAMSDFGASRRSFEEGRHGNHSDPSGNATASRRGSGRRGGGFHVWS